MLAELRKLLGPLLSPILRKLTRFELRVVVVVVAQPLLLILLALVIAAVEHPWIVLVWFVQFVVVGVVGLVTLRRRLAERRGRQHNPQVTGFLSEGFLEVAVQRSPLVGDPDAARRSLARLIQIATTDELLAYALHAGTRPTVDAVVLRATQGALDLDGLLAIARLEPAARARSAGRIDADAMVGVVRIALIHDLGPDAVGLLLDLALDHASRAGNAGRLRLAEVCIARGRVADAARLIDSVAEDSWQRRLLLADLINPAVAEPLSTDADAWLALVAPSFTASGIEPVELCEGRQPAFDRLSAPSAAPGSAHGPVVSVIMSTFRPGDETVHAVCSIIEQTWADWELLVMDDASGTDYDAVLDRIARMDDRIRVVKAAENGGTYRRRNDALLIATGEFVTMQDSDDWSHPRRLEVQAGHLLANPATPANLTSALRVTSDLRFTQPRGLYLRLSEPSLMFRREAVVGRIGFFDSTRKSADSEYRVRIETAFGTTVPHLTTRGPLMLMRYDLASLSGQDFADGWTHPARVAYRNAYLDWTVRTPRNALRVPYPLDARPFNAPSRVTGADPDRGRVDVLVVLDARRGATLDHQGREVTTAVERLAARGARVGIMHAPGFLPDIQEKPFAREYHQLVGAGHAIEVIARDETVSARIVAVWSRDALLGVPAEVGISADSVVIVRGAGGAIVTAEFARQLVAERFERPAGENSPGGLVADVLGDR